jgi:hypothetical protein
MVLKNVFWLKGGCERVAGVIAGCIVLTGKWLEAMVFANF